MGKKNFDLIQILCIQIFGLSERLVSHAGPCKDILSTLCTYRGDFGFTESLSAPMITDEYLQIVISRKKASISTPSMDYEVCY